MTLDLTGPRRDSPGSDSDIFQLRLDSATSNLENLAAVLATIQARADSVRTLQNKLSEDRNHISESLLRLNNYVRRLKELAAADQPQAGPLRREVENVEEEFQSLQEHLSDARQKSKQIFCLKLDPLTLIQSQQEFTEKVKTSKEKVGDLRLTAAANGPESWTTLKDLGSVWTEYLDYLGGLCLRYEGLDSGICEIGDALIQELKRSIGELGALAVPGRESAAAIRPNLVFLRFPEWTVWALPLAAHELWHVAASQQTFRTNLQLFFNQRLDAATLSQRQEDPLIEECLADAFATYTMGPAYACAALSLALDPLLAEDQQRAHAILGVLKAASEREIDTPHEWVQTTLGRLWRRATEQAGSADPEPDPRLATWTHALVEYLSRDQWPINLRFPIERWGPLRLKLVRAMLDDATDSLDADEKRLRLVLNAAWFARLERPQRPFSNIASTCYAVCMDIVRNPVAGTPPPPRDWPPYGR